MECDVAFRGGRTLLERHRALPRPINTDLNSGSDCDSHIPGILKITAALYKPVDMIRA
jgi:hypothetical protein